MSHKLLCKQLLQEKAESKPKAKAWSSTKGFLLSHRQWKHH